MQSARDERIPGKLICAIVAVGSLAFFGILTETVMNVLFPQLMGVLHISEATIQWLTTGYLLVVPITVPLSAWLRRRFRQRSIFLAATRCSPRCSRFTGAAGTTVVGYRDLRVPVRLGQGGFRRLCRRHRDRRID